VPNIHTTLPNVTLSQPDVRLTLDIDGVIKQAVVSNTIAGEGVQGWVGRAWPDTVGSVGTAKVRRMVEDARVSGVSAFWQVTQQFPSGLELPIEYTTVRQTTGGLVAIGKSLQAVAELQSRLVAAQHAMEQDYWKLREVETRYRLLFDASNEAVLLLRADSLRVVEANPAAMRALGLMRDWEFLAELAPQEREPFRAMLLRVREQGKAPGIVSHLGPERRPWAVRASLINATEGAVFLLQLVPVGSSPTAPDRIDATRLEALVNRLPDGFVVLDAGGVVRRANLAFVDLVQAGAVGAVVGERLDRWLRMPGADMNVLLANLRKHGTVRAFSTTLHGELGTDVAIEISAAGGDSDTLLPLIGLVIRDVGRQPTARQLTGIVPALALYGDESGKASLKDLVQDAVGVVERHYVESALLATDGNRTAAAELLGVSRQSLYAKLNRYGMEGGTEKASIRSD
jgi:transcriptional regulator PpsR